MHEQAVLVVDPDDEARDATVETISEAFPDATVLTADSRTAATDILAEAAVDAVVTRYLLGDGTGLDLTAWVREHAPDTGCLLYADTTEIDTTDFEETIVEYVPRGTPAAEEQLVAVLKGATEQATQAAYPLPDDERGRLEAVATYAADTEDLSGALERVAKLAADHFGVDVASVNLIREHDQQFLACHGAAWPPTTRDESICTYTILEDRTMAVPDTTADPRFVDNDTVQSSDIRAYLGANLRTPEGHNIGSLCVYDDVPREFSAADEAYLATLADLAMDLLVLRGEHV